MIFLTSQAERKCRVPFLLFRPEELMIPNVRIALPLPPKYHTHQFVVRADCILEQLGNKFYYWFALYILLWPTPSSSQHSSVSHDALARDEIASTACRQKHHQGSPIVSTRSASGQSQYSHQTRLGMKA